MNVFGEGGRISSSPFLLYHENLTIVVEFYRGFANEKKANKK